MRFIEIPALITEDIEDPSIVDITEEISVSISGTTMTIDGGSKVSGEATVTLTGDTTVNAFTLQNIKHPSLHKISVKTGRKGNFTYVPNDTVTASSVSTTTKTGSDFEILLITTNGGETYVDFDMADYTSPALYTSNALTGFDISELTSTYGATAKLYKPDGTLLTTVNSATTGGGIGFGSGVESIPGDVTYTLEVTDDLGRTSRYDLPRKWINYAMGTTSTPGFQKFRLEGIDDDYTTTVMFPSLGSSSTAKVYRTSDHGYLGINFKIQGRNSTGDDWVDIANADEDDEVLAFGDFLYHRVWVKPTAKATTTVSSSNVVTLTLSNLTEENVTTSFTGADPYDINESTNTYVFEETTKIGTVPFTVTLGGETYTNAVSATTEGTAYDYVTLAFANPTLSLTTSNVTLSSAKLYKDDVLFHTYGTESNVVLRSDQTGTYQAIVNDVYYSNRVTPDFTTTRSVSAPQLEFDGYNKLTIKTQHINTEIEDELTFDTTEGGYWIDEYTKRYIYLSTDSSGDYIYWLWDTYTGSASEAYTWKGVSGRRFDATFQIKYNPSTREWLDEGSSSKPNTLTKEIINGVEYIALYESSTLLSKFVNPYELLVGKPPTSTTLGLPDGTTRDLTTQSNVYIYETGTYTANVQTSDTFAYLSNVVTSQPSQHPTDVGPTFTFDEYNRLAISNLTQTSSSLRFVSNTYDTNTASNVYVTDAGEYKLEARDANTFVMSNVYVGAVDTQVDYTNLTSMYYGGAVTDVNGVLYTWGHDGYGDSGRGASDRIPTAITTISDPVSNVWRGTPGYTVAAKTSTDKWYMWGRNTYSAVLGNTTNTGNVTAPEDVTAKVTEYFGDQTVSANKIIKMAMGEHHAVALTAGGKVWSWGGDATYYATGTGTNDNTVLVTPVLLKNITVPTGQDLTIIGGSRQNQSYVFYDNTSSNQISYYLKKISDDSGVPKTQFAYNYVTRTWVDLNSGNIPVYFSDTDYDGVNAKTTTSVVNPEYLYAFGADGISLVFKIQNPHYSASDIPDLSGITNVEAVYHGTAALDSSGNVWFWGTNSTMSYTYPTKILDSTSIPDVVGMVTNAKSLYAWKSDGTFYTRGAGNYGQLANGSESDQYTSWQTVTTLQGKTIKKVFGGNENMFVWTDDGVYGVGRGNNYKNGDGSTGNNSVFAKSTTISALSIRDIDFGHATGLVLTTDGRGYMWGEDSSNSMANALSGNQSGAAEATSISALTLSLPLLPTLTFDGYNKLTIDNVDTVETATIKKDGAAFATTTSNTVYIRDTGTYTAEVKGSGAYAIELSKVVGAVSTGVIANPVFTSTTAITTDTNWTSGSGWEVTVDSTNNSTDRPGWKAFDNTWETSNEQNIWHSAETATSTSSPKWLKIKYPSAYKAIQYSIQIRDLSYPRYPKTWKFQGSNNDSDWTDLDTQTNKTDWAGNNTVMFTFSNSTAYQYYRLYITATDTSDNDAGCSIRELKVYTLATGSQVGNVPLPDYTYPNTITVDSALSGTSIIIANDSHQVSGGKWYTLNHSTYIGNRFIFWDNAIGYWSYFDTQGNRPDSSWDNPGGPPGRFFMETDGDLKLFHGSNGSTIMHIKPNSSSNPWPRISTPSLTYDNYNKITLENMNYEDTATVSDPNGSIHEIGTAKTMYVKDTGEYVFKISGTDKYVESNVYVSSVDLAGAPTKPIDFDGYNKLTLIDAGSNVSANVTYFSNTYELGSANVLYINGAGTYDLEMSGSNVFALSNTVVGSVIQNVYFSDSWDWTSSSSLTSTDGNTTLTSSGSPTYDISNGYYSFDTAGEYFTLSKNSISSQLALNVNDMVIDFEMYNADGPDANYFVFGGHSNARRFYTYNGNNIQTIRNGYNAEQTQLNASYLDWARHTIWFVADTLTFKYYMDGTLKYTYTSTNAGDFHMRDFPFHFGFYSIESGSGSMETRLRKFHYELSNGRITESLIANPDWYGLKPIPSLTFDGYNKLTLENFTTVSDKQWPPADGTRSSPTWSDSDKVADWTITGASYGNGSYKGTSSVAVWSDSSNHAGPYWAFNNDDSTADDECWHPQSIVVAILTIEMPSSMVLGSYELYYRNYTDYTCGPKDWTVEGSNDGSTWTVLDTRTNQPQVSAALAKIGTYTVSNSTSYSKYRLNVTANHGGDQTIIGEWKLFEKNTRTAKLTDPNGSTYALGQTQDAIYIKDQGGYFLEVTNSDQSAVVKTTIGAGQITTNPLGNYRSAIIPSAYLDYGSSSDRQVTICFWYKHTNNNGYTIRLANTNTGGDLAFGIFGTFSDGTNRLRGFTGKSNDSVYTYWDNLPSGFDETKWNFYIFRYIGNGSKHQMYLPEFDYSDNGSGNHGRSWRYVVFDMPTNDNFITDFSVYEGNKATTESWRTTLYNNGQIGGAANETTDRLHYLRFHKDNIGDDIGSKNSDISSGSITTSTSIPGFDGDPSLAFDTYNKLSIENLTPTSTTLTDPNGSSFDIGTATDVYIEDAGTYKFATGDANTFALVSNAVSTTPTQLLEWSDNSQSVDALDTVSGDNFGISVGIDGNYAIVGAQQGDGGNGSAYIFYKSGGTWSEQAKLTASDKANNDVFGDDVDISGDYAIVASRQDDDPSNAGSVYIFKREGTTWTQKDRLRSDSPGQDDNFGDSVAISGDYAVVCSAYDDDANTNSGAIFVFNRNSDETWSRQVKLTPVSDSSATIGQEGALNINGDYLAFGNKRYNSSRGRVYVYKRTGTEWGDVVNIDNPSDQTTSYFGQKGIAMAGDYLAAGSTNISVDGVTEAGAVYVFKRTVNNWSSSSTFDNLIPVSGLGSYPGVVYWVYDSSQSDTNNLQFELWRVDTGALNTATNGIRFSKQSDGSTLLQVNVGDDTGTPSRISSTNSLPDTSSVTLTVTAGSEVYLWSSNLKAKLIIPDYCVHPFDIETWVLKASLSASDKSANAHFGSSMRMTTDTLVIGAQSVNSSRGQVYIFERTGEDWTEVKIITASDAASNHYFGHVADISGTDIIVGAYGNNKSYFFDKAYRGPELTYDTSNKLSITNLTPTSTTLTDPNGSSFDIGTASNVYIRDSGKYSIASKDANTFALASTTVTGTPTGTTYVYDSNTFTTPSQTYDTTKTITVKDIPTDVAGKIYKGSTAYTIHATTSSSNVIIKNTGTYVSVFTTATQAFFTNAIGVTTQPTTTSDDTTIEDVAPIVTTSVDTILAFHYGSFDTVYGDADVTEAANNGHIFDDTPSGTYDWGTLGTPSTASNQTTYTWTPSSSITGADVLMVAGGGGGGGSVGAGGGGAGGLLHHTNQTISGQNTIVIGNGGTGGIGYGNREVNYGEDGKDTTFTGFDNVIGGGGGGSHAGADVDNASIEPGRSGGSGGGAGYNDDRNGGNGTSGQGNGGGSSYGGEAGGGGGGAGSAGGNASNGAGASGGTGIDKTGVFGTMYGDSGWFASGGGGGGRSENRATAGTASQGGGSSGKVDDSRADDAQKHTGGGGGGGGFTGTNSGQQGGNGGSGIVLLKFINVTTTGGLAGSTAVPDETTTDAPSVTLDATDTTVTDPTLDLDFTTTLPRTLKRYNGVTNSSIGARFNRHETNKKRIEKSINTDTFSMELTANNASSPTTLTVTVSNSKFVINDDETPTLGFIRGETYTFDQSDASNSGHPLVLATSADGTQYTTGWTTTPSSDYIPGVSGAQGTFIVPYDVPDTIYYKCTNHAGMGGEIHTTFGNTFSLGEFTVAANTHVSGEYTLATNYDGTTSNLYVNGSLITQTTPSPAISAGVKDFILGKEFDGYVKNFKFWNYAKHFILFTNPNFTGEGVLNSFSGVTLEYVNTTGVYANYIWKTSSGNIVTDSGVKFNVVERRWYDVRTGDETDANNKPYHFEIRQGNASSVDASGGTASNPSGVCINGNLVIFRGINDDNDWLNSIYMSGIV
jgi:alpha-tubulin suppressor-like RCC1 family protein